MTPLRAFVRPTVLAAGLCLLGLAAQAQTAIEQVLAADRPMSAWLRRALGIASSAPAPRRQ